MPVPLNVLLNDVVFRDLLLSLRVPSMGDDVDGSSSSSSPPFLRDRLDSFFSVSLEVAADRIRMEKRRGE